MSPTNIGSVVAAVLIVSTLARLVFAAGLDYGVDEAYAVSVSRSFQWSFFDHPPIAFWTAGLMQALFGDNAPHWLIRLPFVLGATGTLYLVYALGARLFSAAAGLWGMILMAVAPFFFASAGSWIVPDGPVDLFLAACALLLARILYADLMPEDRALHWLALGVTFGLAALSKYHAFLFAVGAVVFLLATPHRRLLARPAPWIAGLIALALFSPVIYWNATHGWISLAFQSGRSGVSHGFYPVHLLQMLAGEAAYLLPWTLLILLYALVHALGGRPSWLGEHRSGETAWFLVSLALPAILLFTFLPMFGARGLPHWPMPGWLFVFPIAGALLARADDRGWRWPTWVAGTSAGLLAALAIAIVTLFNSTVVAGWLKRTSQMLGPGSPIEQVLNEGADWKGLDAELERIGLAPTGGRFVVTFRWFNASRVAAALGSKPVVTVFNPDARGFAFLVDQRTLIGQDAIVIAEPSTSIDIARDLAPYFEGVDPARRITIAVAGGIPKQLDVTLAHHLKAPFPLAYGATPVAGR
jgi:4-amino-4-deoxy-L-arabinose transferase-like glycosyltransferase